MPTKAITDAARCPLPGGRVADQPTSRPASLDLAMASSVAVTAAAAAGPMFDRRINAHALLAGE